jgi:hypothetical protein
MLQSLQARMHKWVVFPKTTRIVFGLFFENNPNGHFLTKKSGLLRIKQPKKLAQNNPKTTHFPEKSRKNLSKTPFLE